MRNNYINVSNNKDNCLINNSNSNNHSNNNIQDEQQNPTKRDNIKTLLSKIPNEPVMFNRNKYNVNTPPSKANTHNTTQTQSNPLVVYAHNFISCDLFITLRLL